MQSLSQADATIKELRKRMGDDVGLLSYLPDEKVRTAPFDNKAESGGHPLPLRLFFGKLEPNKTSSKSIWVLLHNKRGSNRPPECRLKVFSQTGQLEEPITLDEAIEKASPMSAFTCLKPQHGRPDRAHLSSVLRYYFILQRLQLPTQWPISDLFIAELKAACRVAKANAEDWAFVRKGQEVVSNVAAQSSGASTKSPTSAFPPDVDVYSISHKAIKGSRPSRATPLPGSHSNRRTTLRRSADSSTTEGVGHGGAKASLAEMLFGECAEAPLEASRVGGLQSPTCSAQKTPTMSPEAFITSYRLNCTENEARERRLAENRESQIFLRAELEQLEEEENTLKTALKQSKAERKRLRTSVSSRDLALLQLGHDLAHTDTKRLRFDDSGEE